MTTLINEAKLLIPNIYHGNVNVNFTVRNVTLIKSGISINVGVSAKRIIFRILLFIVKKILNI